MDTALAFDTNGIFALFESLYARSLGLRSLLGLIANSMACI
jgi:hypothetical protein